MKGSVRLVFGGIPSCTFGEAIFLTHAVREHHVSFIVGIKPSLMKLRVRLEFCSGKADFVSKYGFVKGSWASKTNVVEYCRSVEATPAIGSPIVKYSLVEAGKVQKFHSIKKPLFMETGVFEIRNCMEL